MIDSVNTSPLPKPKILVVDDRMENIHAIKVILQKLDIDIFTATSGVEALRLTLRQEFALILLDVEMPDMGGYEVASLMHDHSATQLVPIIFVTANDREPQYIRDGYDVGAVDYLFKPIEQELLLSKVKIFINLFSQKQLLQNEIIERKQAEKLKDEFIALVSHELRTPLTSIQGSLGLIIGKAVGDVDDKVLDLIKIAQNNSNRLIKLINELLDIQKIQSGNMELEKISVNIVDMVQKSITDNQAYGEKYNITFQLVETSEDNKTLKTIGDPDRLAQVMANLLSNAAKFSHPGGVVKILISSDDLKLKISVIDEGDGIPEEFKGRIFQKFAQADSSSMRSKQGTGLGLNLSKSIIEEHQGQLSYESKIGVGTIFNIILWKEE